MFDIGYSELLLIAIVALVVIGPKDLPNVMRTVGKWVGKARGMARHFRSGIDTMMREAELEEMEKKWREDNERIMREHPLAQPAGDWGLPATPRAPGDQPPTEPDQPPADPEPPATGSESPPADESGPRP
jgi:sec-independent protein translocase protein TatB